MLPYRAIPTLHEQAGYAELKKVLNPRWSVAARCGYISENYGKTQSYEGTAGFRPNRFQLLKFGYELKHLSSGTYRNENNLLIQLVTTLRLDVARN